MSVKIVVSIDDTIVFSQATSDGSEVQANIMCSQADLPAVMQAIEDALSFCSIFSAGLDNANRVGDVASPAS